MVVLEGERGAKGCWKGRNDRTHGTCWKVQTFLALKVTLVWPVCWAPVAKHSIYDDIRMSIEQKRRQVIRDFLVSNELRYRFRIIDRCNEHTQKLELVRQMLVYMVSRKAFFRRYPKLLASVRKWCQDWVDIPDVASIRDQILETARVMGV